MPVSDPEIHSLTRAVADWMPKNRIENDIQCSILPKKQTHYDVEDLSDECLKRVFKYLPLIDRIKTELGLAIRKYQNLHTLCIENCSELSNEALEAVAQFLKNLKVFSLCGYFKNITSISSIASLTNLEILDVSRNQLVTDCLLEEIANSCRLLSLTVTEKFLHLKPSNLSLILLANCLELSLVRNTRVFYLTRAQGGQNRIVCNIFFKNIIHQSLRSNNESPLILISDCCKITGHGIEIITTLPKLEHLSINHLSGKHEFTFHEMLNLKTLQCCKCEALKNDAIQNLLETSSKIEFLDIAYCKSITEVLLHSLRETIHKRKNKLTVNICGTRIMADDLENSTSLQLINQPCVKEISIDAINDDCMYLIFQALPLSDQLKLDKVCKRWNHLSKKIWRNISRLDWTQVHKYRDDKQTLLKVIDRSCSSISHIDVSVFKEEFDASVLSIITSKCSNLKSLDITNYELTTNKDIKSLPKKKLKKFLIGPCKTEMIDDFISYLNNDLYFFSLEYLKIISNPLNSSYFLMRPSLLETLILYKCNNIFAGIEFAKSIESLYKLQNLTIESCISPENIAPIRLSSSSLKKLRLRHNWPQFQIHRVPKLEVLDLSDEQSVSRQLLTNVRWNYGNLSVVDITNCSPMTDDCLRLITILPNLQHLSMSNLTEISDRHMNNMLNLKTLRCCYCINVYNAGLFQLLDTANQLELLDLTGCKRITNHLVNYAIEKTKKRINGVILQMHVGGTDVQTAEIVDESPYLQLLDLPVPKMRLESVEELYYFKSAEELFSVE